LPTFNGTATQSSGTKLSRFNDHGLTGCLTLYKSKLFNTNFDLQNGACEDILNINNSYGHINEIKIKLTHLANQIKEKNKV